MDKNKIIEAAAKLVAKGAYDKAIKEYQKVLEVDPKDIRVLQKMGELYVKKNDNAQAAHFFTKVAESYSSDGFFLKAVALYKQVLKLNPNLLEVNLKLAELHQQLGLMSEAMAYFQIVANHYDKAGDTKSSLDTLKKMVDLDPENVASKIKLAELYARENMTREAIQEFKRAAEYLKRNSRGDDWARVAERLSTLEPDNLPLAKELATSYLQRGDQKRALAKLQVCFKADGRDVETLSLLAQAFQGLGQTSKTVSVYKELAKIHQERGRQTEAEAVWTQIEVLDPQDPDLLARRAPAPAPAAPQPAPAPQPSAAPQPAARAAPQPAAQAAPAPVAAPPAQQPGGLAREQLSKLLTETDVYVKYGLHDKALEHLRKVFSVDPENLDAHEKAYQIYVASGNTAQASEQLLNVLRLCTRAADSTRAQPYLATILQQNPSHPEVPAFLSVLRVEGPVVATPSATVVESVGEDAILVDSSDDEVLVAPPPEDALLHPPGDELALATLPSSDSDEVIDDESDATVVSEEALVGEAITSGEHDVFDTPAPEDLAADAADETLVSGDDDGLMLTDEPGLASSEDEPLVESADLDASYASDEGMSLGDSEDEATSSSMAALSLGDEDEPPPTMVRAPTRALLQEAAPNTRKQPVYAEEAPLDVDEMPTRVGIAPLDASMLDELEEAPGSDMPSLGDPFEEEEPTASHAIVSLDDMPAEDPETDFSSEPQVESDFQSVEEPQDESADFESEPQVESDFQSVEEPEEASAELVADGATEGDEEEPAAEECDEAAFFLDQGLLEEAREILETVSIAFPGHARATELMERLEAMEASGGAAPEEEPLEPISVPSVQPVTDAGAERDAFDLAAELAGEIDNLGDDTVAPAPAEEDFQYSVEEVFSEFKKGLAKVVKPEDVDTHYDLGIAYKEMGLLDDALHEFEVARQGSAGTKREVDCLTMMGMLHLLRGDGNSAVETFREGLASPHATGEAAKALGFELALAYEANGEPGKALHHYQRVAAMDAKYRDVGTQVSRLAASTEPEDDPLPTPAPAAVNGARPHGAAPAAAVANPPVPAAGAPKARKVGYV